MRGGAKAVPNTVGLAGLRHGDSSRCRPIRKLAGTRLAPRHRHHVRRSKSVPRPICVFRLNLHLPHCSSSILLNRSVATRTRLPLLSIPAMQTRPAMLAAG